MNPVLILVRNNLAMTLRCIDSALSQTIPVKVMLIDNDSDAQTSEGLRDYVRRRELEVWRFVPQLGVSEGWNFGIRSLMTWSFINEPLFHAPTRGFFQHVLVLNNDTVLPPWFYESLLDFNLPFVTGTSSEDLTCTIKPRPAKDSPLLECPDFSAFLIRRGAWEMVGQFDSSMVHYASDCDYHVRAHRAGMSLYKAAEVEFYHERSSTMQMSSDEERAVIEEQANKDRGVFLAKYGCLPGQPEYAALFETETVETKGIS